MNLSTQMLYHGRSTYKPLPLIGRTSDYVPVFTMYRPWATSNRVDSLPPTPIKERFVALDVKPNKTPLENILLDKVILSSIDSFEFYRDFLAEFRTSISEMVNDNDLEFQIKTTNFSRTTYDDLFNNFKSFNGWSKISLRSAEFVTNLWFLMEASTNRVLCTLVAKPEMIPYLRMCFLMNEEPHPEALEFWVDKRLDVAKGEYKNLRSRYRKEIRQEVVSSGIQIVEVDSVNELLFHKPAIPKFKTISDKKQFLDVASEELLELIQLEEALASANIKLVA